MKRLHPAKILVLGYIFYSIVGCIILSLPVCHREEIHFLDNYFTAISAVSTTGLATIDIGAKYNFLGQLAILIMVQLGGIGYMTFSSFILLCTSQKLSAYRRKIGASTFAFPKDFSFHEFIFSVIIFSFLCELIGAVALSIVFWKQGIDQFIWNGIFHSVSAFCTAGLSLFQDGFISLQTNIECNLIICILMILGSLGFIVSLDFYKKFSREKKDISFTTKVILVSTFLFASIGTILFFSLETITDQSNLFREWMIGFFQVVSAMTTTGFNSVDIGTIIPPMIILLAFLSTFGSAPSGTGGGLKNTSFTTLVFFVKNTLKGKPTTIWNHIIPANRVKIATVAFIYYIFSLSFALFLLSTSEHHNTLSVFFEAVNALNNSGLSMGLTAELTNFGKALICILMLMGRVGILTFGVAISSQAEEKDSLYKKAELII